MATEDNEVENQEDQGEPKEEKVEKPTPIKKKKQKAKKPKKSKTLKLMGLPEPSQQIVRAAGGGLLGVLAVVALTYVLWGIITDDSILYAGSMFDMLSMGNGFNSLMGVWAFSFTPLTSISDINENWVEIWYYFLAPVILAGVTVGITTRRILTAILGGLFFIFWGIVIPILFVYVFSVFGITDPALVDGILFSILDEPLSSWNYDWLLPIFNENLFISWTAAGALEIGILVTVIALPLGALFQLIG